MVIIAVGMTRGNICFYAVFISSADFVSDLEQNLDAMGIDAACLYVFRFCFNLFSHGAPKVALGICVGPSIQAYASGHWSRLCSQDNDHI